MLRPPSLQRNYDEYFSGDPAFAQPAGEGDTDHAELVRVARETGDWSRLRVDGGGTPTKFILRPMPPEVFRLLSDRMMLDQSSPKALGIAETSSLILRTVLVSVSNLPDGAPTVKLATDARYPEFGKLAPADVMNYLDSIDRRIVSELSNVAFRRAANPSPKS